jgi:uncharacterized membrane protein HdeD (DUF308 family)
MSKVPGYVSKVRGYVALGAGVFLVAASAGLYFFFANLAASGAMTVPEPAGTAFFQRLDFGFLLLAISGMVGIVNGIWIVQREKMNAPLTIIAFLVGISALSCFWQATKLLPPD